MPLVSVIIPCRNEEKYIGKCLESIANQDFPKENLEVLVVDGTSQDKTREIIKEFSQKYPFIKLLDNPQKYTPFGLNIGIKASKGEVIIRMDSHARYENDYISKCVKYLGESNADNVGGIIKTLPAENTIQAKAIAFVLSGPLGAASAFRLGSDKPQEVDTVFGGCYKREVFDKIGLFNEKMIRSQDIEFNKRLKKAGGKIMLYPDIIADYFPQANLFTFLKHNFSDGFWVIYPLKFNVRYFSLRHLLPAFLTGIILLSFIFGLFSSSAKLFFLLLIFFYLFLIVLISLKMSFKRGGSNYLWVLPLSFFCRHFGYGFGSLWGLIRIIF